MTKIVYIALPLLLALKLSGQNLHDKTSTTYEVTYYDLFSFSDPDALPKEWNFDLTINHIEENKYEACYSKELVNCLYEFYELRRKDISVNKEVVCFKYSLTTDNGIIIKDNKEPVEYIKDLHHYKSLKHNNKRLIELFDFISFYDEDIGAVIQEDLDEAISRELKLIHEYENIDIPIGVSGIFADEEEDINFEELEKHEIEFLSKIDWESLEQISAYKTAEISDSEFSLDYLFGVDIFSFSDIERPSLQEISESFFSGTLVVNNYENANLSLEHRKLNINNKKLSYLLQQGLTKSPIMKKATRLEIKKK